MSRLIAGNKRHLATLCKMQGGHTRKIDTTRTFMVAQQQVLVSTSSSSQTTPTKAPVLVTKRQMSDNLLGYNPMSGSSSTNKNVGGDKTTEKKKPIGPMIGVDSNNAGGGVWAQQNAKRDKLAELRLELNWDKGERTLDDAANEEEKRDLFLIDGIAAVASLVDGKNIANVDNHTSSVDIPELADFVSLLEDYKEDALKQIDTGKEDLEIDRQKFEAHISHLLIHVRNMAINHQFKGGEGPPPFLANVRDIMLFTQPTDTKTMTDRIEGELGTSDDSLTKCHVYYRILLLEAALQCLLEQWDTILTMSDSDMDRAATKGETLVNPTTMSLAKIHALLRAFATGSCTDRVKAMWDLMDKDDDGLLDQSEMDTVVEMTLKPLEDALRAFVTESVNAWPMRAELPPSFDDGNHEEFVELQENLEMQQGQKGRYRRWVDKRKEKKAHKNFIWAMERTIKRYFDIDVETPHRLRCAYAWAEKKHQDGKVESVLVDDGLASRKRYVELDPKISYEEFREMQEENFGQLDRVTEELCTGLKEELWILQGKRRERDVLKREGGAFLAVVAVIDFAIMLA